MNDQTIQTFFPFPQLQKKHGYGLTVKTHKQGIFKVTPH